MDANISDSVKEIQTKVYERVSVINEQTTGETEENQ